MKQQFDLNSYVGKPGHFNIWKYNENNSFEIVVDENNFPLEFATKDLASQFGNSIGWIELSHKKYLKENSIFFKVESVPDFEHNLSVFSNSQERAIELADAISKEVNFDISKTLREELLNFFMAKDGKERSTVWLRMISNVAIRSEVFSLESSKIMVYYVTELYMSDVKNNFGSYQQILARLNSIAIGSGPLAQ